MPPVAPRVQPQRNDRVQRRAAERRRQRRVDGQVVQRVGNGSEVGAHIGHLLLAPVAAATGQVGRDAAFGECAFV